MMILDWVAQARWFRNAGLRRAIFAALALVSLLLCVFPRNYRATVTLVPPEAAGTGLSPVLGGLGGNVGLFSSQPAEVALTVARSYDVTSSVARRLDLARNRPNWGDRDAALVKLDRKIDVRALRGGMLQIRVLDHDPRFALAMVKGYASELQSRLSGLSRTQVSTKRAILDERLSDAASRLRIAQSDLAEFRRTHGLPAPEAQLAQSVSSLNTIQAELDARRADLATEVRFSGPENYAVKRLQSEIAVLQGQLAAQKAQSGAGSQSAAQLANVATRYADLERNVTFAQGLYQSYQRYLEGSAVEELAAANTLQQLDPTHLDPGLQINNSFAALFVLFLLCAIASEFYVSGPPPQGLGRTIG